MGNFVGVASYKYLKVPGSNQFTVYETVQP